MFFSVDNNWCWFNDVIVVLTFIGVLPEFLLIFQQINAAIPLSGKYTQAFCELVLGLNDS